jgi:GST-like protein
MIADMATSPLVPRHEWHGVDLARGPNVQRWSAKLAERPAV